MITLRYRSFKSEAANLPPSSGTNGLNSGGITGNTFNTIFSGLFRCNISESLSLCLNALTIFNLFTMAVCSVLDFVFFNLSCNSLSNFGISILLNISSIAPAPVFAINLSSSEISSFEFSPYLIDRSK